MEQPKMTRIEFRNMLKDGAMKLLQGDETEIVVTKLMIGLNVEDSDCINETYIRNAINQYGRFKASGGRVKVSARGDKYVISLMDEEQIARLSGSGSITHAAINSTSIAQVMAAVIEAEPDLSEMSGKQLEAAVKVISLYRASLIEKLKEITNHEQD